MEYSIIIQVNGLDDFHIVALSPLEWTVRLPAAVVGTWICTCRNARARPGVELAGSAQMKKK